MDILPSAICDIIYEYKESFETVDKFNKIIPELDDKLILTRLYLKYLNKKINRVVYYAFQIYEPGDLPTMMPGFVDTIEKIKRIIKMEPKTFSSDDFYVRTIEKLLFIVKDICVTYESPRTDVIDIIAAFDMFVYTGVYCVDNFDYQYIQKYGSMYGKLKYKANVYKKRYNNIIENVCLGMCIGYCASVCIEKTYNSIVHCSVFLKR